ncbi:hypothetical protein ASE01_08770 [Nocardioides sp. Root190]|uniref:hypothetical protein n=1 Tax=Nocardioides sp. Root190 TaxID=1736488 RepID=UPI0006F9BB68|nr:hypothetical protein [Nocardioides sp. Root190]KRB76854.1 hypothetical protein ASE01_08770 [Nocardioides sp. Root190]
MTDGPQHFPPPGAPPPEESRSPLPAAASPGPGQAPPPGAWAPYAGTGGPSRGLALGAAHKPGAFPLRPLNLGAIYDGAFRIIRFNPKATVGAAVLVTAVAMVIPVLLTTVLTFTVGLGVSSSGDIDTDASTAELVGALAAYGSLLLSVLLSQVGVVLVTGMIAHVTRAAAVGRRLDLRQAWDATRGQRWRLIGLTVVINLMFLVLITVYVLLWVVVVVVSPSALLVVGWALVTVPAFICLCCWMWIRLYYLPVPALMLEGTTVFGAIGRGWTLTSQQFWRTFGIGLLTVVMGQIAGGTLAAPVTIGGQVGGLAFPEYAALVLVVTQAAALVIQNAFIAPFLASVASIQYVDLRIRKEALDVELMREAGILS